MPDSEPDRKPASESMLASSSLDKTPQIGIVLSSFRGGAEHDGTPIAGLKEPCPADAALSAAQADALLRKAVDLARNRRRGGIPAGPEDWVVLKVHERADIRLVRSVLSMLLESKRGRRFSIASTRRPLPAMRLCCGNWR